jgi:hypothetical protein
MGDWGGRNFQEHRGAISCGPGFREHNVLSSFLGSAAVFVLSTGGGIVAEFPRIQWNKGNLNSCETGIHFTQVTAIGCGLHHEVMFQLPQERSRVARAARPWFGVGKTVQPRQGRHRCPTLSRCHPYRASMAGRLASRSYRSWLHDVAPGGAIDPSSSTFPIPWVVGTSAKRIPVSCESC